ncbi:MAG: hypothetical protein J6R48_09250, partial [Muribaculaceae bacterium]|nr:hypothetical protein [Muribaculaceae bacterium]
VTLPWLLPPSTLHSDDSADCSDFAFAATPTTLHSDDSEDSSDIAFAAPSIDSALHRLSRL